MLTFVIVSLAPSPAPAAEPAVVREIRFVYRDPASGAETPVDSPSPQWFAGKTRLQVGQPWSDQTANDDLARFITEHGMLCREARTDPVADGVRVTYVFERRQRVWSVRIVIPPGCASVGKTDLIKNAVKLRRDDPVSLAAVNIDRWAIVEYLRRDGYHFATVNARIEPVKARTDAADVVFEVDRGPKVQPESIVIRGNAAVPANRLLNLMQTRKDGLFTSRRFVEAKYERDVEAVKRYYIARGWEDAKVTARPVLFDPEFVRITVRTRERGGQAVVTGVSVSGAGTPGSRFVRRGLVTQPGAVFSPAAFEKDIAWLSDVYYKAGFRADPQDVRVRTEGGTPAAELIFARAKDAVTLAVTVRRQPDGTLAIDTVDQRTTGPFPDAKIAAATGLKPGLPFSDDLLLEAAAAVARLYTQPAGEDAYALMDLTHDRTAAGAVVRLDFMRKGRAAWIRIDVSEGEPYRVESVSFEGLDPVLEDHIRDRLRMQKGSLFTREDLAADLGSIQLACQEKGYADAKVQFDEAHMARAGQHVYDLKYIVTPGELYYVDVIRPRGNDRTKPSVIVREMALKSGDRYDARKVAESKRRLQNLGYFEKVEVSAVDGARRDDKHYKDLVVEVQEAQTRHILIGAGASSAAGVFADLRLQDTNFDLGDRAQSWSDFVSGAAFTGGGQALALFIQPGTQTTQIGVRWREPWLNERPVELALGAGFFSRDWDTYTVTQIGGDVTIGKRFTPETTVFAGLRAHHAIVSDISDSAPPEIWSDEGAHNILGLSVGITHDTIDRRDFPTEGARQTLMAELIGTPFFDALKLMAEGRWYVPVHEAPDKSRQVVSFWGDVGLLAGADLPVFERFYAGGLGSVRGFATHGISPLDNQRFINPAIPALGTIRVGDGEPIGGKFKIEGGVEYHFPIIKDRLRGLVFLDAGSVAESTLGLTDALADLRVSAGVGLHFLLPYLGRVPLAVYLGVPLKKASGDQTEAFSFSIGILLP